jgi:hypothetical protein
MNILMKVIDPRCQPQAGNAVLEALPPKVATWVIISGCARLVKTRFGVLQEICDRDAGGLDMSR